MRALTIEEKTKIAQTLTEAHHALCALFEVVTDVDEESINEVIANDSYNLNMSFDEVISSVDYIVDEMRENIDKLKMPF